MKLPAWLFYALLAIFWWGVWGALAKVASATMTPGQMQALFAIGMLPLAALALWQMRGRLDTDVRGAGYGILNGVFSGLGLLAYNAAIARGQASIVGPVTALFPLVTVVLAVAVLRERINRIQGAGIVLALGAIYLLAE
ncbi:MAG TPA: DMT family transporter [Bryobacteraceae bacterium]|nr:DMT family transporter [Bryobacteraceae bacterium]